MTQYLVIPAKLSRCAVPRTAQPRPGGVACLLNGIQTALVPVSIAAWTPAFAGVTGRIW
jgi:hypothetical protein